MSLFIDRQNRRKSPFALGVFCMTLMDAAAQEAAEELAVRSTCVKKEGGGSR